MGSSNTDSVEATAEAFSQRKANAQILASQYTASKRAMEIATISLFCLFLILTLKNLYAHFTLNTIPVLLISCVLAMAVADLFSGLVHWAADTWGTLDAPFVGKTFIRSFREHHVDPFQITRHDVIETNGDNCLPTVPILGFLSFVNIRDSSYSDLFAVNFLFWLAFWVALTNQIHKWSHMHKPPAFVTILQDWHIILSKKDHQLHHHTPFDKYYCITNGWLNPFLASIGFWKRMEDTITWLTGLQPREDDAHWTVQSSGNAGEAPHEKAH
mmetsp:Transcript_28272/g.39924  ORF Transcript_28272/g.39924 Transcript_28272/m.39924 type:complete len:271 (+) Transcript_28272:111-923(+)